MTKKINIFVAGSSGMVGSSLVRALISDEKNNVITKDSSELDLTNQSEVKEFFKSNNIDQVYLAAAKVGGIYANNKYPADFIYENIMIESNIIHQAYKAKIKKLLFLGSSCIYPKYANQPMKEEALLSGLLEPTNEPYAISKIAGIKLCESYNRQHKTDYRSVMPTNLYGMNDNYHPNNSHVIPGLIRRFHECKINNSENIEIWGTGNARREFLYVDDMASACIFVMNLSKEKYLSSVNSMISHINIGFGSDITIRELAYKISKHIGFKGELSFDTSQDEGALKKLLDSSRIFSMGWSPKIDLDEGIKIAYDDFILNNKTLRT
jgi:GDP-L-fucose synthase